MQEEGSSIEYALLASPLFAHDQQRTLLLFLQEMGFKIFVPHYPSEQEIGEPTSEQVKAKRGRMSTPKKQNHFWPCKIFPNPFNNPIGQAPIQNHPDCHIHKSPKSI